MDSFNTKEFLLTLPETQFGDGLSGDIVGLALIVNKQDRTDDEIYHIFRDLIFLVLNLANESPTSLKYVTQRPYTYQNQQTYIGLSNLTRSIFVSGPHIAPPDFSNSWVQTLFNELEFSSEVEVNKNLRGARPAEFLTVAIFDSQICDRFCESLAQGGSQFSTQMRLFFIKKHILIHLIFYNLTAHTDIADPALMTRNMRQQSYIQNTHNAELIKFDIPRMRALGLESKSMVFRKNTRNHPALLIIGTANQNETVFITSGVSFTNLGFIDINLLYVISRLLTTQIMDDILPLNVYKYSNFIILGYLYEFLSRIKADNIFINILSRLGRFSAWSPRVRKPPVSPGDTTLSWFRRSSKRILTALAENKTNQVYLQEASNLFIELGNAIPFLYTTVPFQKLLKNLATEYLQRQVPEYVPQTTEAVDTLAKVSPVPPEWDNAQSPGDLATRIRNLSNKGVNTYLSNLELIAQILQDPYGNFGPKVLIFGDTNYWRTISYWNRQKPSNVQIRSIFGRFIDAAQKEPRLEKTEALQHWTKVQQNLKNFYDPVDRVIQSVITYLESEFMKPQKARQTQEARQTQDLEKKQLRVERNNFTRDKLSELFQNLDPQFDPKDIKKLIRSAQEYYRVSYRTVFEEQVDQAWNTLDFNKLYLLATNPLSFCKENQLNIFYDSTSTDPVTLRHKTNLNNLFLLLPQLVKEWLFDYARSLADDDIPTIEITLENLSEQKRGATSEEEQRVIDNSIQNRQKELDFLRAKYDDAMHYFELLDSTQVVDPSIQSKGGNVDE